MRPHRLELTAFGPFADTVAVDLDALSAAGVFLLHGETGAGKTTLLDGIGFALFGRVPGERGKAKRLRSDQADDTVRTRVVLEVTLAGRRLRITRHPQQDRPSSRGGTTTAPAKVALDELVGGQWQSVSTRVGEADAEISALLGMSAEQFFQVVLLPQGEFATFLRADATKRGELLARLFGTDRFRAVEDWLAERRRATTADVDAAERELRVLAARLSQVVGRPEPGDVTDAWVAEVVTHVGADDADARRAVQAGRAVLAAAQQAADSAALLAAAQARRRQALAKQARLAAARPALDALRDECDAAVRAAVVRPRLDDLALRTAAEAQAAERAAAALVATGHLLAQLPALLTQQRSRVVRLQGLQAVGAALAREELACAEAAGEAIQAGLRQAELTVRKEALPDLCAQAQRRWDQQRAAALDLPVAVARRAELRAAAAGLRALLGAQDAADQARDELVLARETSVALREKALEVRAARVDGMVAELAFHLERSTPCPVCGGLEHPDPSLLTGARVTRDDEDSAQAEADAAQRRVEDAAAAAATAQTTVLELQERWREHLGADPGTLEEQAAQLDGEVSLLQTEADASAAGERALGDLQAEQSRVAVALAEVTAALDAARRRATEAAARRDALTAQLRGELEGAADLPAALAQAEHTVGLVERAGALHETHRATQAELRAAQEAATGAAVAAGFADAEQAAAVLRDAEWLASAAEQVATAERDEHAVAVLLADPATDVPLEPAAPVEQTALGLAVAVAAHDQAVAGEATAQSVWVAAGELGPMITTALAELAPLRATAEEVRHLADLAAGTSASNALRMSLSSYILAARLEEVALAASERLLRMSQGRFSLVHTDSGRGGGRAGLGLLARDSWTGQDRETSTLSGGETFLASLALALGLADVVTAEAGGARIEALFVDEGFGTLDEDTLDEVMDVLDDLREGGRVVGVVSHVAELRHRIPSQVRVHKERTGSALSVVSC